MLANGYAYEPFGPVKATVLGNGLSVANDWGNDGRLASRRLYRTSAGTNLSWLSYVYDKNDNITAINDQLNAANNIIYGYDPNDRLNLTATGAAGTTSTDTYNYTTGTNRLSSVVNGGGTRAITYDGRGNTATESRPGSVSASTTYDGYGRLTGYTRTDVGARTFVYNGRDDRVSATNSVGTRRFVYDADGRVLGEYGASATDVKAEFIWALPQVANDNARFGGDDGAGGYLPLVVATPNSAGTIVLNWVHGNHLGVPLVTTDASGNTATTPNDYLQPGFPGQSWTIADLYYNRYRDYDPNLGRYIQADPIGLGGGQNDYAYAANNPVTNIDPLGLNPAGAAAGGIIGGWIGGLGGEAAEPLGGGFPGAEAGAIIGRALGDWMTNPAPGSGAGAGAGAGAGSASKRQCPCPECKPYPVGRIGQQYKINTRGGRDVGIPHYIIYEVQQNPITCQCIWRERTKALAGGHHAYFPWPNAIDLTGRGRPPPYP